MGIMTTIEVAKEIRDEAMKFVRKEAKKSAAFTAKAYDDWKPSPNQGFGQFNNVGKAMDSNKNRDFAIVENVYKANIVEYINKSDTIDTKKAVKLLMGEVFRSLPDQACHNMVVKLPDFTYGEIENLDAETKEDLNKDLELVKEIYNDELDRYIERNGTAGFTVVAHDASHCIKKTK